MQVIMSIAGIKSEVVVLVPDYMEIQDNVLRTTSKEEAEKIAIETVCTIKESNIDVIRIT